MTNTYRYLDTVKRNENEGGQTDKPTDGRDGSSMGRMGKLMISEACVSWNPRASKYNVIGPMVTYRTELITSI